MRVLYKILKISGWVAAIVVVGLVVLAHTVRFRKSDDDFRKELAIQETEVAISYLEHEEGKVRSVLADRGNEDLLILLHGSPSSSAQWVPMVNDSILSKKVDFLLIDRPGYGYSSFGDPVLSVEKVASFVQEISATYRSRYQRVLLLGTSYGGTVAARLLMDYPDFYDGAMLVSSSLAPGEEYTYPISHFMEKVPWVFPTFLNVANKEKLNHHVQLEAMEPFWENIQSPLFFMHSTTDDLVYPANVDFALEKLSPDTPAEVFWVPNAEHSMFWSDRELFFQKVNEFLDEKVGFKPVASLRRELSKLR